ncbi:surface lipoprotein assembly modifier [Lonepinella sp. BR2474]|uniref:surface lipoprotein assembly modifier n=1 Tax=Lonepinella sp. BR2474 TaxID=3434548 RepID=UPI003F6E159B
MTPTLFSRSALALALIAVFPTALFAAEEGSASQAQREIDRHFDDQRMNSKDTDYQLQAKQAKQEKQALPQTDSHSLSISKEELVHQPELVIRALLPAVAQGNAETVAILYPIYQKIDTQWQDPLLTQWQQAILARKAQHYSESIRLYREILAQHNDVLPARLQLAAVLFENKEYDAAEGQFEKLRSEKVAPEVARLIDTYINAIHQKDRWSFGGGLTYLNDPNINNAPKSGTTYGNWSAPKRQSAQGFGYNLDTSKKWSWGNGFYHQLDLSLYGKYYWNNKKYNEMTMHGGLGLGYQTGRSDLSLIPFWEQTLYAGGREGSESLKRFSKSGGGDLAFNYWLNPKWQWRANYQYSEQRYTDRKHLNGNTHYISSGLSYLRNAQQYWYLNLSYNRTSTRDSDDSYVRRAINLGWVQEWGKGLSTRVNLSYGQKNYKGPLPVFNITQRNKEYGAAFSIWHRAIHYKGITPRLTYSYHKTKSNHVFYTYDKHQVYLELSKRF